MKKLNLGIIGNGRHFKKNIYPAIKRIKKINKIDIYKKKNDKKFFSKNFDIIYISCDTGLHEYYISKCLKNNFNVMCEKPFTTNIKKFKKILNLATKKNLLIFECFMYKYHGAYKLLKKYLKKRKIKFVYSAFKIPSLNKANFRYKKSNGGFFWDTAVYPISLETFLINSKFKPNINGSIINKGVSLSGNINIKDKNSERFYKWGENQKYENSIEIITNKETFYINKFFSKNKNEKIFFEIYARDKYKYFELKDDQFYNMFNSVLKNFKNNNFKKEMIKQIWDHFLFCGKIFAKLKKINI